MFLPKIIFNKHFELELQIYLAAVENPYQDRTQSINIFLLLFIKF